MKIADWYHPFSIFSIQLSESLLPCYLRFKLFLKSFIKSIRSLPWILIRCRSTDLVHRWFTFLLVKTAGWCSCNRFVSLLISLRFAKTKSFHLSWHHLLPAHFYSQIMKWNRSGNWRIGHTHLYVDPWDRYRQNHLFCD